MRVVVGIDDSDESFYALQWALDYLFNGQSSTSASQEEDGHGSFLTLVHVHQPLQPIGFPQVRPGVAAYYPSNTVAESLRKSQEEISAALLSRALQMCKNKMDIKVESLILEGNPKDKLCEISEQMHVDLLIVGSRGLGKIKRAFLGSVSDYCAHHAKCPTLIVKPPKEEARPAKK